MKTLLLASLAAVLTLQAQPRLQRFTLPNGLRILHLEDHEHPLVRARLHLRVEPGDAPPGRQGLAQVMLLMLGHADTADLKAEAFDRILEESGIQLLSSQDSDGFNWRLVARSRDQDRALGLLADRLLRTVFTSSVLAEQRSAAGRQEAWREDPPLDRLQQILLREPARPGSRLDVISLEELLAFRARVFRPDRAVLVIHGDLGLEQAKRLVLLSLGSWTAQKVPAAVSRIPEPAPVQPAPGEESQPRLPAPGRGLRIQAVAVKPGDLVPEVASLLGLLVPDDGDLPPVRVAMKDGWMLATLDREPASGAGAWSLFHERLASFRQRGFTQADLDRARRAWLAGRSLDSLHPEAQMDAALADALGQGVAEDRIKVLSLETLNAGLKNWLDPARLRVGAAGDPEELKLLPKP